MKIYSENNKNLTVQNKILHIHSKKAKTFTTEIVFNLFKFLSCDCRFFNSVFGECLPVRSRNEIRYEYSINLVK